MMPKIPSSLRLWFIIHFWVDVIFALPLMLAPVWAMSFFGFSVIDPLTTRLVGAALIGIGGASLLSKNADLKTYQSLLQLKILWSLSALVGIGLYLWEGGQKAGWLFFGIFLIFTGVWNIYYQRIKNKK